MNEKCVVLFDIDGTLLRGPAGRRSAGFTAMYRALARITGSASCDNEVDFAGRTDRSIARLLLQSSGRGDPSDSQIDALLACYLENLAELVNDSPYQVLGDPEAAVSALRRAGAFVGLGTGNIRGGARIKLANAEILHLFDLECGGYGDDGEVRAQLISAAALRCDPSGRLPLVIVGDTPHDIEAAHACGAYCVAVPFGRYSGENLLAAGADRVVPRIGHDLEKVVYELIAKRSGVEMSESGPQQCNPSRD